MARTRKTKAAATVNSVTVALNYPTRLAFDLKSGKRIVLNGNAENLRGKEKGQLPTGGFGLTVIQADEWEEIKSRYGNMKLIRNGLLFASTDTASAEDEAEEKAELRNGREPAKAATGATEAAAATAE